MNEQTLFTAAMERDPAQRSSFLDEACGNDTALRERLDKLLRLHENAGDFLERPAAGAAATVDHPPPEQVGTMIGDYRLMEEIGQGGMGSVFVALQKQPVRRKVALKVIKPGMDSRQVVSRFEAERQALALMDHPSIARVFDGGSTESGRPYFVMELVNGEPITDYCNRYRFTTEQRLELFRQVCHAVQHAHQKGIIHRDIKPSNILVTHVDGQAVPKVIDFGIAKATGRQLTDRTTLTNFGQMLGTPLYMSPEQADLSSQDVDTRSDVYSLGVLLYELLTAVTPFDHDRMNEVSFDEFRRIIREEDPPRPSARLSTLKAELDTVAEKHQTDPVALSRRLRSELDWIVMKSLDKDRRRRYESASDFAKDIQRYLDDDPVEACPPSTLYRLQKYATRHKGLLTTAALLATTMLLATSVSVSFAIQAGTEKNKAVVAKGEAVDAQNLANQRLDQSRVDFERALTALDTVVEELSSVEFAKIPGVEKTRAEVFDRMLSLYEAIAEEHDNDPYARRQNALAYDRISGILALTEQEEEAEKAVTQGIKIMEELLEADPRNRDYKLRLTELLFRRLNYWIRPPEERLKDALRAIALREELVTPGSNEHIDWIGALHYKVAYILREDGPRADEHIAQSIRISEERGLTPHPNAYHWLAQRAQDEGDSEEAVKNYRHVVAGWRRSVDAGDLGGSCAYITYCTAFAQLLNSLGQSDEARTFHLKSIDVAQQLYRDYGRIPAHDAFLGSCMLNYVKDAATKPQQEEAFELIEDLVAKTPEAWHLHPARARLLSVLDDAEAKLTAAIEEYPQQADYCYSARAELLLARGEANAALDDYSSAIELLESRDEQYQHICWWFYTGRAKTLASLERFEEALADYEMATEVDPGCYGAHNSLFCYLVDEDSRDWNRALAVASRMVEIQPRSADSREALAKTHMALGEYDKALADYEKVISLNPDTMLAKFDLKPHGEVDAYICRGLAFLDLEKFDQAITDFSKPIELGKGEAGLWYYRASARLGAGDIARYRNDCAGMLERFGNSKEPEEVHSLVWTHVLAPEVVSDYGTLVRLAEQAVEADPDSLAYGNALGAVLCRAGRFSEAIPLLTEAAQRMEDPGAELKYSPAYIWYFLAMAHHELGGKAEAQRWRVMATEWTEKLFAEHEEGTSPLAWNRKLTLELLREETELLFGKNIEAEEVQPTEEPMSDP